MKNDDVYFSSLAGFLRKKYHNQYLKLMDSVEPIVPEVLNPEMLEFLDKEYISKKRPVSYVANHTNSHDIPVAAKAVKKHFYVFIAKEGLNLIQKIGFILNGPIWIKRKDKESRRKSQLRLIKAQKKGYSTLTYSEASWNTISNKFMNKLYTGVIKASKITDVDIIPLIFEYIDDKCYVKIGKPFVVDKNKNSRQQADELRDIMTTMRVELLEEKTDFYPEKTIIKKIEKVADSWNDNRFDKEPDYERINEIIRLYEELKDLKPRLEREFNEKVEKNWSDCPGLDRNFEASCIYKEEDSPDEAFEHLGVIKDNPKAKFLFKAGIKGYTKHY